MDCSVSPSLTTTSDRKLIAYEMKFILNEDLAQRLEELLANSLILDPHTPPNSVEGSYETTTVYCDTPDFDIYHRRSPFRRRKFRLRRYNSSDWIFLERKSKHGMRVRKHRSQIPSTELPRLTANADLAQWEGDWFRQDVSAWKLEPVLAVCYARKAYVGAYENNPIRLTFDRRIVGIRNRSWCIPDVADGHSILAEQVICEFKFRGAMPTLFKVAVEQFHLAPGSASKYRLCLDAAGGPSVREMNE